MSFNNDSKATNLLFIFLLLTFFYFCSIYLSNKLKKNILLLIKSKIKHIKKFYPIKKNLEILLNFHRSLIFSLIFPIIFLIISKFLFILFSSVWFFLFIFYKKFRDILKPDHILFTGFLIIIVFFLYFNVTFKDIYFNDPKEYMILSFVLQFLIFRYWIGEIPKLVNSFYQINKIKKTVRNNFFLKKFSPFFYTHQG